MRVLELAARRAALRPLPWRHSDDIEIGAGATILGWIERGVCLDVHWAVLSATGQRADEARASAADFLANAAARRLISPRSRMAIFPIRVPRSRLVRGAQGARPPDVILSHWHGDAHQDHREVSN